MAGIAEFEARILAAESERDIDALLGIDLENRRIAWAPRARKKARELADRAAHSAADIAGEPVSRLPEFSGSEDGRTPPARVPGRPEVALPRSDAQRAADRRYDARREPPITVRLSGAGYAWLDAQRKPRETRAKALCRLAGVPG